VIVSFSRVVSGKGSTEDMFQVCLVWNMWWCGFLKREPTHQPVFLSLREQVVMRLHMKK